MSSFALKSMIEATLAFLLFSILGVMIPFLFYLHVNLSDPLDASTINGMIAIIAITFGFISFEAREIKPQTLRFAFLLVLIAFLILTSETYFMDVMQYGHATKLDLLVAMANLFFNAFCYLIVVRASSG